MKKLFTLLLIPLSCIVLFSACGTASKKVQGKSPFPKSNRTTASKPKPPTKTSTITTIKVPGNQKERSTKATKPTKAVKTPEYKEMHNPEFERAYMVPIDSSKKSHLLAGWEKDFRFGEHKIFDRYFLLKPFSKAIPGEPGLELDIVSCKPKNGYNGYYEPQDVKKDKVVLHFTVGNIRSDIDVMTRPRPGYARYRESVPFILARDGTVYQLFKSSYWSHHLGKGTIGGNVEKSKSSIAIEISNYGPLILRGDKLETVYSRKERRDVYCSIDEKDKYMKLATPFKGYQYFARFTDEQYEQLIVLLRYLTATYDIPRNFLSESQRFKANEYTADFKGIVTHLNFRKTGKWDIGPAFDWERVIEGLEAKVYTPKSSSKEARMSKK